MLARLVFQLEYYTVAHLFVSEGTEIGRLFAGVAVTRQFYSYRF